MADVQTTGTGVELQRIYGAGRVGGGYRVLVDGLWPRGISKDAAALDEWAKDAAPSADLRCWYGHDPQKFETSPAVRRGPDTTTGVICVAHLVGLAGRYRVILLTGTRDLEHSGARVLRDHLVTHQI